MTNRSTKLSLPYILPQQAQKHVTHNDALQDLDTLVHLSLRELDRATPPTDPQEGAAYSLHPSATGIWANHAGEIAAYQSGAWRFYKPENGWRAWHQAAGQSVVFQNGAWQTEIGQSGGAPDLTGISTLGINGAADDVNRLTVASEASLFNHAGQGHQLKINKAMQEDTASLLFQNGFSGRAEMGVIGEDNFTLKVTPDGNQWVTALDAEAATGQISFPSGLTLPAHTENLLINSDFAINQRVFAGGALPAGQYGHDRWKAMAGGADYQISGARVDLQSGRLEQIIEIETHGPQTFSLSLQRLDSSLTIRLGNQTASSISSDGLLLIFEAVTSTNGRLSLSLSGQGSFERPMLVTGKGRAQWSPRLKATELALCARYFTKSFISETAPASVNDNRWQQAAFSWHPNVATGARAFFPTEMRARPVIAFYSSTGGQDGQWYILLNGQFVQSEARASRTDERGFMPGIFNPELSLDVGNGYFIGGHWTADAEL